jgi:hypothetical protein
MQVAAQLYVVSTVSIPETVLYTVPEDGLYELSVVLESRTPYPSGVTLDSAVSLLFRAEGYIGRKKFSLIPALHVDQPRDAAGFIVLALKGGTTVTYMASLNANGAEATFALIAALKQLTP